MGHNICVYKEKTHLGGLGIGPLRFVAIYKHTLIKLINYSSRHCTNYPCQTGSWCLFGSFNLCVSVKRLYFPLILSFHVFSSFFFISPSSFLYAKSRKALSGRSKRCNSLTADLKKMSQASTFAFHFYSTLFSFSYIFCITS